MGRQQLVILSRREIEKMRAAGKLAAKILDHVAGMIRPGVTTQAINDEVERLTQEAGAVSAQLGYHGFTRSVCTSINEVVCHGIPSTERLLAEGDIVAVDVTPKLDGYHGDSCRTFAVGKVSPEAQKLIDVTRECLQRGISAVAPGRYISDIGKAISEHAESNGFSVVRDFVGHGIGATFHAAPQVPHFRPTRRGMRLRPGMAFTIEPMINQGGWETEVLSDGWTAVTRDRTLSAQFEHTLLVTKDDVEVLTLSGQ